MYTYKLSHLKIKKPSNIMRTIKISILLAVITLISLTSCTHDDTYMPIDTSSDAYNNAAFSKGGIMYDKFWSTEAGFDQSNTNLTTFNAAICIILLFF